MCACGPKQLQVVCLSAFQAVVRCTLECLQFGSLSRKLNWSL